MSDHNDLIEDEGAGYLISVSDMMSGLLFIFIITLVAFILNFQDAIQKQKEVTETQKSIVRSITNREQLRSELLLHIKKVLEEKNIIVEVDADHGVLRLTEQAVLFETAQDSLNSDSLYNLQVIGEVMRAVVPCYATNPPKDYCKDRESLIGTIDSIFIEGHTDNVPINSWKFKDNLELSANRAMSAFRELIPNTMLDELVNTSNQPIFSVSGYGDGRPVDGHKFDVPTSDPVNRRIDIRFIMTPPTLTAAQQALIKQGVN